MPKTIEYTLTLRSTGELYPQFNGSPSEPGRFNEKKLKDLEHNLRSINKNKFEEREDFVYFGTLLYEALLEPVKSSFVGQVWTQLRDAGTYVRLRLVFEDQPETTPSGAKMINLPWEFLYYPNADTFLATDPRLSLSCGYENWLIQPLDGYVTQESPLRVLFVHAHPDDLDDVGFADLVQKQCAGLQPDVAVTELSNPAFEQLRTAFEAVRPHVFHFLGHGAAGKLAFRAEQDGSALWYAGHSFSDLLRGREPKFIVLQACEGAAAEEMNNFSGTAARLVQRGVPAVLAFRYPINEALAWNFIKTLYAKLADHQSLDKAVQAGREVLSAFGDAHTSRDFGAPVLWSRLRAGCLFSIPSAPEQPSTQPAQPSLPGKTPPDSALQNDPRILDGYLYRLFRDASPVNLSGIQRGGSDDAVALWEVYTALLTQRSEQHERLLEKGARRAPDKPRYESAVALLNKHQRLVLLGDAGSGKSTLVNFLILCLTGESLQRDEANLKKLRAPLPDDEGQPAKKQQPWKHGALTPVKIVLRDFAAKALPLPAPITPSAHFLAFLEQMLTETGMEACFPALRQRIEQGQALLLFDGLDEVPETGQFREQTCEMITACAQSFRACRILVTSRTYAYQRQLPKFTDAVLLPFAEGQIRWFARCWYAHVAAVQRKSSEKAEQRAHALQDEIFADARVRDMAQRPLLLTMIANLHEFHGSIPKNQVQLYSEAAELLLQRWERRKFGLDDQGARQVTQPSLSEFLKLGTEGPDLLHAALAELAFQAHSRESLTQEYDTADIAEKDLVARLFAIRRGESQISDRLLITYLRDRAGILILRGNQYTFPHRSFQEYLAAWHLYNSQEEERFPQNIVTLIRRDPERWREVFWLAVQMANPDHAWRIVEMLCPPEPDDPEAGQSDAWGAWYAAHVLARQIGLEQIKFRLDLLKKEKVRRWLKALLTAQHPGEPLPALERAQAGDLLAAFGDDRPGVGLRPDGLPDIAWCPVPAGTFPMGSDPQQDPYFNMSYPDKQFEESYKEWIQRELPQHPVTLPAFQISRYPVTNAQYHAFVNAGGYADEKYWTPKGWQWRKKQGLTGPEPAGREFDLDNHPVVKISWYEAMAFCKWLTMRMSAAGAQGQIRLPTEAEWEYAARGPAGRVFPWKGDITPEHANYGDTNINATSAVGCFPQGRTWCGAEDMTGNVWEWCLNPFYDYAEGEPSPQELAESLGEENTKVLRGGAWFNHPHVCRCAFRYGHIPGLRDAYPGLRVVVAVAWTL